MKFALLFALALSISCLGASAVFADEGDPSGEKALFVALDVNMDGALTVNEFSVILRNKIRAAQMFRSKDRDFNGVLTLEEFITT